MSVDMFPDAAVDYLVHHSDPESTPDGDNKIFVLVPLGPLYELYGYESDVAEHAQANPDAIYFWAEGDAETFAPELSEEAVEALISCIAVAVGGPTAAQNSGAIPYGIGCQELSGAGVETANEGVFVVDGVTPWRPLEVLEQR